MWENDIKSLITQLDDMTEFLWPLQENGKQFFILDIGHYVTAGHGGHIPLIRHFLNNKAMALQTADKNKRFLINIILLMIDKKRSSSACHQNHLIFKMSVRGTGKRFIIFIRVITTERGEMRVFQIVS